MASNPEPTADDALPVSLGKYQLLKKIATGGMAEIWVARARGISGVQQICVVKRILPEFTSSAEFVRMFLDEARIATVLNHPNLIQTYDVGEASGKPFIAMEYLHGEDLRTLRKTLRARRELLPLEHAVNIVINAAAGLHHAHEKVGFDGRPMHIVHRDISPHNLFITVDGHVKILDFGIAKATNRHNETRNGALKGKFPYMSPEQCLGKPLDRRSDIYSLGVILYEITTGRRIHKSNTSEFEVMRAIVDDPVTPPSAVVSSYPADLEQIVLKCLAKDRSDRYSTARELQADLTGFAQEARLGVSSIALSSFMSALFGDRVEAWREALAKGDDLLAQIEERPPSVMGSDDDDKQTPLEVPSQSQPVLPASMLQRGRAGAAGSDAISGILSTSALQVTKRVQGKLLIIGLAGRLTEGFEGKAIAGELSGRVLFDMAGVERITSFGVREWLELLSALSGRVTSYYLCRCSEAVVNQMSMIRRFAGDGQIVSFFGPYRCDTCGQSFQRLFDAKEDAAAIQSGEPPTERCPRCGAPSAFDDDVQSYFAFAREGAGKAVPADVRAALSEIARAEAASAGGSIEKTIEDQATRIRVRAKIDGALRWPRVLDGMEGKLIIDLAEAPGITKEGAANLELALRALGDEVLIVEIEAAPQLLLRHLAAQRPLPRAVVISGIIDARCPACDAIRPSLVSARECGQAIKAGRDPYVPCKRCNTPLSFADEEAMVRLVAGERLEAETIPAPRLASDGPPLDERGPPAVRRSPAPVEPPEDVSAPLAGAPAAFTSPLVYVGIAVVTAIIVASLARVFLH